MQPKTEQVRAYILDYIKRNNLSAGEEIPSNRQLMRELGVSQVTITSALKKLINDGLLERFPGQPLQVRKQKKIGKGTIAIVVPAIMLSYFYEIINGLEEVLRPAGYSLNVVYHRDFSQENNERLLDELSQQDFSAIIMAVNFSSATLHKWRSGCNIPMVLLEENLNSFFHEVVNDNIEGGRMVGNHLIKQGCKRVIFAGNYFSDHSTTRERFQGLCMAWEKSGLPRSDLITLEGIFNRKLAREHIAEYLDTNGLDFDGVFCYMDLAAAGICEELLSRDIKVPRQVKVAGYSNLSEVGDCPVGITSVDQDLRSLAGTAARELIASIESGSSVFFRIVRPVQLVVRGSTVLQSGVPEKLFDIEVPAEHAVF